MDGLVRLLELAYASGCVYASDIMRYGFQREVQEEREVQMLMELRGGDGIVLLDSIMYFQTIREFEAEKLANLHLFLQTT
ncbi:hypothetical protein CTI12_AA391050 [Artemisia annua]|uniref:Uncharacterized protein n=1 Tax=Artemisia annua TaxID=35608 RepID=A0A2U1MCY3_ARTAN|nr:hypothetical protein CTI12_AA391050 [Artemisia annua]